MNINLKFDLVGRCTHTQKGERTNLNRNNDSNIVRTGNGHFTITMIYRDQLSGHWNSMFRMPFAAIRCHSFPGNTWAGNERRCTLAPNISRFLGKHSPTHPRTLTMRPNAVFFRQNLLSSTLPPPPRRWRRRACIHYRIEGSASHRI